MKIVRRVVLWVCAAALSMSVSGCGGPATFVSTEPPPQTTGEAWYASSVAAVRAAVEQAMIYEGMAIDAEQSTPKKIVGWKPQAPYIDEDSGEPAPGHLPVYELTCALSRPEKTHVVATVSARMQGAPSSYAYEWEYPGDILKSVFEGARKILNERRARYTLPPRYARPPARLRPPRP